MEKHWRSPYAKFDGSKVLSAKEGLETVLNQFLFDASACGKMYESKLFNDVRYPEQKNHEDIGTTYKLFLKSKQVSYTSIPLYYYLQREGSILHDRINTKTLWDGMELVEQQYRDVTDSYPELKDAAMCRCFSMYCRCYKMGLKANDDALVEMAWNKIHKNRSSVVKAKNIRKKARYAALLSMLGKSFFSVLIVKIG